MIHEQTSSITPADISFFENLIKLEEITGFIETNKLEAGSPQISGLLNSATSVYGSINNLLPRLSDAAKEELKTGQDLYNDMMGVNVATLQDVGGDNFNSISETLTKAWDGLLSVVGINLSADAADSDTTDVTGDTDSDVPVDPTSSPSEEPTQSAQDSDDGGADASDATPMQSDVSPRPTVRLSGSPGTTEDKSKYASRYLPKQPARSATPSSGPTYYIRMGPGRYQPASPTDQASGAQLFMKNPNPALRMVYPYVKVESMIKKARRATAA